MRLKNILPLLAHENYTVVLQSKLGQILNQEHEVLRSELKNYLEYRVLGITEDWRIIIQDEI